LSTRIPADVSLFARRSFALALLSGGLWSGAASAQAVEAPSQNAATASQAQPEDGVLVVSGLPSSDLGAPGASALAPAGSPAKRDPKAYARFDALREPMLTTQFPGIIDTILGDAGGFRSRLADHGIGVEVQSATSIQTHLTDTGMPSSPQVYNGQKFTVRNNALNMYVTKNLADAGLGDTIVTLGGGYSLTSFDPNGRNSVTIKTLSIYHGFANRKIEVKAGFLQNYLHFAGLITGGNPTLTTGLVSLLPVQAGLSAEPATTPGINVQFNGKKGFYVLGGVQRSLNPRGIAEEIRTNGIGLDWDQKNAKALYIGEIGIRRRATPTQRSFWARAGYLYNTSDYNRFLGGVGDNHSYYALIDVQATRPDDRLFFRGLYLGASYSAARKSVSSFSDAAEVRAYYVGPFDARPTDSLNVTVSYNRFSEDLHDSYGLSGIRTARDQVGASAAYAVHVGPGARIAPALQYIWNPTFLPGYKNVLLGSASLYLAF
jgi:carbohydrate-selective porin OprB